MDNTVVVGVSGYTGTRIVRINGHWHFAECFLGLSEFNMACDDRLANIRAAEIDRCAQALLNA